jgi:1-aminocyclopropane-1-carboxylate deaminase/D-cysteine desulfhydrase-like pyridoxal-dependent ACC family enzyme
MLAAEGRSPYLIPVGGSSPTGALGFVAAMPELTEPFDAIYFASASLSTQAGLTAGLAFLDSKTVPHGVMVGDLSGNATEYLAGFASRIAGLLKIDRTFAETDFLCDFSHLGAGYAQPTEECIQAISLVARMEGVFVDPVYSGKAMAGLIADARSGRIDRDMRVLFWHTGGAPTLFAQEYADLPRR